MGQLNERAVALRRGGVTFRNSWRGEVLFDPKQIVHIYGVVVLVAEAEPFEWRELVPDVVASSEIPVQVFSLFDLAELLHIFDTPNDLLVYELRSEHGRSHRMLVGQELETFKDVLGTWDQLWPGDPREAAKTQEYFLTLANAVLRTPLASESGYRAWATSRLIDCAFLPADERAPVDSFGRRAGSTEHESYVGALESVGELSRLRRSHYGEQWLEAADEAIAEGRIATRKSYSPKRSRSYVLVAMPLGQEASQKQLDRFARETVAEHGTESCLVVAASAASVRGTYEAILHRCRGEDAETPAEHLLLSPTVAWGVRNGES